MNLLPNQAWAASSGWFGTKGDEYKFSSKGINKQQVQEPLSIFRSVLETGEKGSGQNTGFRLKNNTICTYTQVRDGFSYLYCKRQILDDGTTTIPLDITLNPSKKPKHSDT